MSPRRFRLDGASLSEVRQRVTDEHGPDARIIAVEQVTTGGLGGFFASRRYEVTVEVPDSPTAGSDAHDLGGARLSGIAALLEQADAVEADAADGSLIPPVGTVLPKIQLGGPFGARAAASVTAGPLPAPAVEIDESELVSTSRRSFADVLEELQTVTEHEREHPVTPGVITSRSHTGVFPPCPPLGDGAGDLVVVLGLTGDALAAARAMSFTVQAELVVAGASVAEGLERIDGRRDAITVRAKGVHRDRVVIAAYGLSPGGLTAQAQAVAELKPDQVWLAVDAGRKHDDTARWVKAVTAVLPAHAVAGLGRDATSTPDTVRDLSLPVTWAYDG